MKTSFMNLFALLLALLPLLATAQKEVELEIELNNATIIDFKPPYREMAIYFEEEETNRHGIITLYDTTMFVKKSAFNKKKKSIKPDELMQAADFRAGMKINLQVGYFQISNRTDARRICLDDKYYGNTTVTGLYERLDGDRAIIDGQMVVLALDKGKAIEGREEWKGKTFTSFSDMQLGSEVQVSGERKTDGIVYAKRGTMRPSLLSKEDYFLRKAMDQELRVTKNALSLAEVWNWRFISNERAQDYVNSVGRRLIPEYLASLPVDHPDFIAFKFYLVDDGSFNASSYANGAVVVHKGLLTKLSNEAQLAALLGHEIAHVTLKHHAQQFRNGKSWNSVKAFGEVVAAGTGSTAPAEVTQMTAKIAVSSFSQKQETQADRTGLYYMVMAGYDPREASVIWKRLAEEDKDEHQKTQQKAALNWVQKSLQEDAEATKKTNQNIKREQQKQQEATEKKGPQPIFPMHPNAQSRYTHVTFLLGTSYAHLDFAQTKTNVDKYKSIVSLLNIRPAAAPADPNSPKPKPKSKKI